MSKDNITKTYEEPPYNSDKDPEAKEETGKLPWVEKKKKKTYICLIILIILLLYVGSYILFSRTEFKKAEKLHVDKYSYFCYPKPGPVPGKVPLKYKLRK